MIEGVDRPESGIPVPNARVTGLENEFISSPSLSNLTLAEQNFPQRPGFGTQGKQVAVWANFVELLVDPRLVLHVYRIEVEPKAAGKKLTRVLKLFLDGPDLTDSRGKLATDFRSTLVSILKLSDHTFNVLYRSEGEDEPVEPDARAKTYHVHIRYTNSLAIADFLTCLDPTQPLLSFEKGPMIQAMNILLNHVQKSSNDLITVGSRCFPIGANKDIADLGSGLQAIRGFYSSIRAATGRILVNVNVSYGVFFQPGSLKDLVSRGIRDKYKLNRTLKGLSVNATHLLKKNKSGGEIPRIKTILGLASAGDGIGLGPRRPRVPDFGAGPKHVEFWLDDQQRFITVYDFFRSRKLLFPRSCFSL